MHVEESNNYRGGSPVMGSLPVVGLLNLSRKKG